MSFSKVLNLNWYSKYYSFCQLHLTVLTFKYWVDDWYFVIYISDRLFFEVMYGDIFIEVLKGVCMILHFLFQKYYLSTMAFAFDRHLFLKSPSQKRSKELGVENSHKMMSRLCTIECNVRDNKYLMYYQNFDWKVNFFLRIRVRVVTNFFYFCYPDIASVFMFTCFPKPQFFHWRLIKNTNENGF